MITITREFDPASGLLGIDRLFGVTFTPESEAHTFRVEPVGEPYSEAAIVSARFLRADGVTVLITGSLDEGAAVITLPTECYAVPGLFTLTVYITEPTPASVPNQIYCVYAAEGTVRSADSDTVHVSDGTIRDIDQQLQRIFDGLAAAHCVAVFARNIGDMEGMYDEILRRLDALESNYTALEARVTALDGGPVVIPDDPDEPEALDEPGAGE